MIGKPDSSWITVIAFMTLVGILYVPTFYDGFCITSGENKETIGVCTRQWMQSTGQILLPLAAIVISYIFSIKQDKANSTAFFIQYKSRIRAHFYEIMTNYQSMKIAAIRSINSSDVGTYIQNRNLFLQKLNDCIRIVTIDASGIHDKEYEERRNRFLRSLGNIVFYISSKKSENQHESFMNRSDMNKIIEEIDIIYLEYSNILDERAENCNKYISII